MDNLFEIVKSSVHIKDVVEHFGVQIDRSNKGSCPFHSEKTGSFSIDTENNYYKCFGCGESGDAIDFVAKIKDISNLEAVKLLADIFNIKYDDTPKAKSAKTLVKEYIVSCVKNIDKTSFFKDRGLSDNTIKKYNLGYDVKRQSVVIPYSSNLEYYQSRSIDSKAFFKPKTEDAGAEPLYNGALFTKSKKPVFVVESPICALSIMQCGGVAVSTCGTAGWRKIVDAVVNTKFAAGVVLCFDNDDPGKAASQSLANTLFEKNIKFAVLNIAGECKDPNELLMKDPSALKENIATAFKDFRGKYASDKDSFDAADMVLENLPPTTWIVQDMLPTGLSMLCAPSKLGKSWMVLQLCIAVAEGQCFLGSKTEKQECLYYALEDGKARLKDRILKVRNGKPMPRGVHVVLKADTLETGLLERIEQELQMFPKVKLVVIDTLQKVRGKMQKTDTLYGNEYREMGAVKDFADKNKICILFVHHLRKMSDDSDVFNMISGSTALMGASDTIFIIAKKKRGDDSAVISMTGRDIEQSELVISFNKNTYSWDVEGTADEIMARRDREDYETNVYVRTIKDLVLRNPMTGWSGCASDLLRAVFDVTGKEVADSSQGVGKTISKYEYKLYCDGIDHKMSRSGSSRKHTFKKKASYEPVYQQSIVHESDE